MTKLESNLKSDEYILWQGKPKFIPFFLGRSISSLIFGIIWVALLLNFFILPLITHGGPIEMLLILVVVFLIVPFIFFFGPAILAYKNTGYIITNKRLLTQTGIRVLTKNFFNLEKIQEINVKPRIIDRLFRTGSIYLDVEGQLPIGPSWMMSSSVFIPPDIASIENPYNVQKKLEQAIYDAKKSKSNFFE
jgi:membrane protein YdbS with pleckstrin-like domain